MKIHVEDIRETARSLDFPEDVEELNELLSQSEPVDYQFERTVHVHVSYYRCGEDLVFDGRFEAAVAGTCSRCLESYPFELDHGFSFVLRPAPENTGGPQAPEEDRSLGFYTGDHVDLSPLLREEMILSLPTRPLCREDCPGLCPQCGRYRAAGSCDCHEEWVDPRLAPLRELKARRQ